MAKPDPRDTWPEPERSFGRSFGVPATVLGSPDAHSCSGMLDHKMTVSGIDFSAVEMRMVAHMAKELEDRRKLAEETEKIAKMTDTQRKDALRAEFKRYRLKDMWARYSFESMSVSDIMKQVRARYEFVVANVENAEGRKHIMGNDDKRLKLMVEGWD